MEIFKDKTLLKELAMGYQPGSSYWVNVTHVNNPQSFYVRLTKCEYLLESLEKQAPTSSYSDVNMQDLITFNLNNSTCSDQYARGRIIKTDENNGDVTCDIISLDYGFIKKALPLNKLLKCNEIVCNIPPLAMHCQLSNCGPEGGTDWSEETIDALKFYIGQGRAKMEVVGRISDKLMVNIMNSSQDDIATLLALTGFTTLGYHHTMISRIDNFVKDKKIFHFRSIIKNDTLHVRMQYGSSLKEFYVAEMEDFINYQKQKVNISNAVKREKGLSSVKLVEDMPVCVLDNLGNYERAIVKSYSKSKSEATVQLVDSGKKLMVHVLNMTSIPDCCLEHRVIAFCCSVEDSQLHDYRLQRILQPGYEFLVTIREPGYELNTPSIVNITLIEKR